MKIKTSCEIGITLVENDIEIKENTGVSRAKIVFSNKKWVEVEDMIERILEIFPTAKGIIAGGKNREIILLRKLIKELESKDED